MPSFEELTKLEQATAQVMLLKRRRVWGVNLVDATALANLLRSKQGKAIELVEAAISRIERINPQINAVVTPMYYLARAGRDGMEDLRAAISPGRAMQVFARRVAQFMQKNTM